MKLVRSKVLSVILALALVLTGSMTGNIGATESKAAAEELTARAGLEKSITYLKAMDTSKYQEASVTKLKDAIKTAEAAYEKTDDTDANYQAARETLETVRANMLFKDDTSVSNQKAFRELSGDEVLAEMGAGLNLGNTLDGNDGLTPGETKWQKTITTKEIIKSMHDAGFNTVRVPVTWGTMIDTKNGYKIKDSWMTRVQEVVDYCTEQDMYCIINIHHDGIANHDYRGDNAYAWLNTATDDMDALYEQFECVWRNIANRFKDYDEHLIFESMNEVTDAHKLQDGQTNDDINVLNDLNQIFVNVVRSTGSNNAKRWLAFVGRFAGAKTTGLVKPQDAYNTTNHLMFAAHIYKDNTCRSWTYDQIKTTVDGVKNMVANKYKVPMYLGEYGVRLYKQAASDNCNGSESGYNDQERAVYSEMVHKACQVAGVCPVVWDQNCGANEDVKTKEGVFSYWDRERLAAGYQSTIDGMMRGTYIAATEAEKSYDMSAIYESYGLDSSDTEKDTENKKRASKVVAVQPTITKITGVTVDDKLSLKAGTYTKVDAEVAPADTNDVLLWSTDDDTVATVSNGNIHAKGVGTTTIHVKSQSGSVSKDIVVTVSGDENAVATEIKTDKKSYKVKTSSVTTIQSSVVPSTSKEVLTFKSSNTDILNVNQAGMVSGVSIGKAYVIITAASGVTKTVPVEVVDAHPELKSRVNVSLHAYYQHDKKTCGGVSDYYGTEVGPSVAITGNGQYTAEFDADRDLSAVAKYSGITNINNIGSLYLKDLDITNMDIMTSNLQKARIVYNKVTINGQEMTLKKNMTEERSTLKGGKVFDSGDPINAWTGTVFEGTTVTNTKVTFNDIPDPKKVSVTFTISGLEFKEVATPTYPTAIDATTSQEVKLNKAGESAEVGVKLTGFDANSKVTFVSSDLSKVIVDSKVQTVAEDGTVTVPITAVSDSGTAFISAYTENGYRKYFSVAVGDSTLQKIPADDGKMIEFEKESSDNGNNNSNNNNSSNNNGTKPVTSDSVKVKKSSVIVAPGKSVKVGFTATKTPTVKSSNKKITAKLSGKNIVISANKKATKGSKATITVTVGSKKARITATVRNRAKKISKAKAATLKKGKTANLTFKVTAENKKAAVADAIKTTVANKKIAKVTKVTVKKGKVIVKVKALKKGKATVTLKIGSKKAKATVKVK